MASKTTAAPGVRLLDGGMGSYLSLAHPEIDSDPLWSAKLLCERAGLRAIKLAHLDFLRAGARCIKTCSYQATKERLIQKGVKKPEEVIFRAVRAARKAIAEFKKEQPDLKDDIYIFRSCGPYHVLLADASEYKGVFPPSVTDENILDMHRNQMDIMCRDLGPTEFLCFETIATAREARLLMNLLETYGKSKKLPPRRVVMSFVVLKDSKLPDGTNYTDIAKELETWDSEHKFLFALGANCSLPEDVYGAFHKMAKAVGGPGPDQPKWGAWPNAGYQWLEAEKRYDDKRSPSIQKYATLLRDLGVTLIGGCCSVKPPLLAKVGEMLQHGRH